MENLKRLKSQITSVGLSTQIRSAMLMAERLNGANSERELPIQGNADLLVMLILMKHS